MIQLVYLSLMLNLISFLLLFLNFIISKKIKQNREKMTPFECGFDPISNNHLPISVQFFLISLIFLIFDIEITLLLPITYLSNYFNLYMMLSSFIILFFLLYSTYLEYSEKSLDWKI